MPQSVTLPILNELSEIVTALTEAAEKRDQGISLDLFPLTEKATALCAKIITLPADDAFAVLPDLQKAVDKLNQLHSDIKAT